MTRNLGLCEKVNVSSSVFKSKAIDGLCSEELSLQSSLRKLPITASSWRTEQSLTASLLRGETKRNNKHDVHRRERVCRSWNGGYGYGTLVEEESEGTSRDPSFSTPDKHKCERQQSLRSIRRASSAVIATPCKQQQTADASDSLVAKPSHRRSRSRIDLLLMPSLKSLVSRRSTSRAAVVATRPTDMGGSSSSSAAVSVSASATSAGKSAAMVPLMRREASTSSLAPSIRIADHDSQLISDVPSADNGANMRKCETVLALSSLGAVLRSASSSRTTIHVEPLRPVNRLRVPPHFSSSGVSHGGSTSRMCSRCSSLLSMASSSRYSLNTAGGGFVPCSPGGQPQQLALCKLCLGEVPIKNTYEILQCSCAFCKDCMKAYIEFEIQEGAYDISCPDAQCEKQGIITLSEIETLVTMELVEKYQQFRLNREVDLDVNRTWCPRAGCETVCNICPMERCLPQSVHCPTCTSDFCSNCKNPWHSGFSCEENSKRLAKEGQNDLMESGIPFDSDLIKCCPMCNVPIEKDEGCAQMMCKRCKHVFCWYCLASLDDDFLLRHYDKGPCKNKLGHSRASVIWHRTQVIGIFAGFGILLLVASPLLLLAAPCIVCCKCRVCSGGSKLDSEDDIPEESAS